LFYGKHANQLHVQVEWGCEGPEGPVRGLAQATSLAVVPPNSLSVNLEHVEATTAPVISVQVALTNTSRSKLEKITLRAERSPGLVWNGLTTWHVGSLEPGQVAKRTLFAMFLRAGQFDLQNFSVQLGDNQPSNKLPGSSFVAVHNHLTTPLSDVQVSSPGLAASAGSSSLPPPLEQVQQAAGPAQPSHSTGIKVPKADPNPTPQLHQESSVSDMWAESSGLPQEERVMRPKEELGAAISNSDETARDGSSNPSPPVPSSFSSKVGAQIFGDVSTTENYPLADAAKTTEIAGMTGMTGMTKTVETGEPSAQPGAEQPPVNQSATQEPAALAPKSPATGLSTSSSALDTELNALLEDSDSDDNGGTTAEPDLNDALLEEIEKELAEQE